MTPMLEPLAAFRDRMLVISGLDNKPGLALPGEPAGGHGRIGGSYLTGVHVKPTEGADFQAGVSIDQIAARELGQHTELASLELSLDTTEFAGACDAGFSCAYTTTLCWRGPTAPLPMEHDPRAVFERLFGDSGSTDRVGPPVAARGGSQHPRFGHLQARPSAARSRFARPREAVAVPRGDSRRRTSHPASRGTKRARAAGRGAAGRRARRVRSLRPAHVRSAGAGLPVRSHARHHVHAGVGAEREDLSRSRRGRSASCDLASPERADNLEKIAKIGTYHSKIVSYYLERLQATPDGDGSLLDHTNVIYGRGMSDSNGHQPIDLPLAVFSREMGGGRHVRHKGVPLMNLYMTLLANLGVPVEPSATAPAHCRRCKRGTGAGYFF